MYIDTKNISDSHVLCRPIDVLGSLSDRLRTAWVGIWVRGGGVRVPGTTFVECDLRSIMVDVMGNQVVRY